MRRRIEELLNGTFEYSAKPLEISPEKIEASAEYTKALQGTFTLRAPDEHKVKGFLYSSDPRVSMEPVDFYATSVQIRWQADVTGLKAGDQIDGFFTVCSDRGEHMLPYRIRVSEEEERTCLVNSVSELAELARKDMRKAYRIFVAPAFRRMLDNNQPEYSPLLRGLKNAQTDLPALEQFLIGCGEKQPVEISLDRSTQTVNTPDRSVSMEATLTRSGWGYQELTVTSDALFLRPEKRLITTESFVGDTCPLTYVIDRSFLHGGKNCGRICVESCYQTLYLDVTVEAHTSETETEKPEQIRKRMRRKLLQLYMDFRLKRISRQAWIDRSQAAINNYKRADGTDLFADLFQVQLYYADNKKVKGTHLLQEMEQEPERFKIPEQYAYDLYLTTFFEKDAAYVDQVEARIEQLFAQNRSNWRIQWILLYLQERYLNDDEARLEAVRQQSEAGCSSPVMLIEAAEVYRRNPYLLRRLDRFEKQVLLFACKEKVLTQELVYHIGSLALYATAFEPKLFRILEECWEYSKSDDILRAICQLLIAGGRKDPEDFVWYARGVEADLRITGLFEYYMETMDMEGIEKMPQIIRRYFSYNNALNYHKKAAIYRDIWENRDRMPDIYDSARPAIERFVSEQLGMGRIDTDLAVLYEHFITKKMLTSSLAERLAKMLFCFRVTCKNPNMKSVIVVHPDLRGEQETPLRNGRAKVQIYTQGARILLSDREGRRYAADSLYLAERMLDAPALQNWCRELLPDSLGLTVYEVGKATEVTSELLPAFRMAAVMEDFTAEYQKTIRGKLLNYYVNNPKAEDLYTFLKGINGADYITCGKKELIELYTQQGMYENALRLIGQYGSEGVDPTCLGRICSQAVLGREYAEDSLLLACCHLCFVYGTYDENILTYLLMFYDGPIEEMKRLWLTGNQSEMDTMVLEEKILSLIEFTRTGSGDTEKIFDSYQKKCGLRKICRAFAILKAYEYFVKDLPVGEPVFRYIENALKKGNDTSDVAKLALLRYYSCLTDRTPQQLDTAAELLKEFDGRGIRFAFYQKFPENLLLPLQIQDRTFLEYVTDPAHTVMLNYRYSQGEDREEHSEPMKNAFEGIFVKEFVLFDTEQAECTMREYDGEIPLRTSAARTITSGAPETGTGSRFGMLGKMSREAAEGKTEELKEDLENYRQLDYLTQEIFTLI